MNCGKSKLFMTPEYPWLKKHNFKPTEGRKTYI